MTETHRPARPFKRAGTTKKHHTQPAKLGTAAAIARSHSRRCTMWCESAVCCSSFIQILVKGLVCFLVRDGVERVCEDASHLGPISRARLPHREEAARADRLVYGKPSARPFPNHLLPCACIWRPPSWLWSNRAFKICLIFW